MADIDILRERIPWLSSLGGELLLIADKPGRNSLAASLAKEGYRVTLLEPRRNFARGAERSKAYASILQGLPYDIAAIASMQGLQWDIVLWYHRMDVVSYEEFVRSLSQLQLVTRKVVVVGDPHHTRFAKDLGLHDFHLVGDLGIWYGGQWPLPRPAGVVSEVVPEVAPVVQTPGLVPSLAELDQVTAIVVGFNTKALTRNAVATLRQAYPKLSVILLDNASSDGSTPDVARLATSYNVQPVLNGTNIGHGPALDQGIRMCNTPYILLLDSDCVVHKAGFIEAMLARFAEDSKLYAVGWLRTVDRYSGVPLEWHVVQPSSAQFCQYVHPSCALIDRAKYLGLPSAFHHGAPMLQNMRGAVDAGYTLEDFPVGEFVEHLVAGTRRIYQGKWNPLTNEARGTWRATDKLPI